MCIYTFHNYEKNINKKFQTFWIPSYCACKDECFLFGKNKETVK